MPFCSRTHGGLNGWFGCAVGRSECDAPHSRVRWPSFFVGWLLWGLIILPYWVPTIVVLCRKGENAAQVVVVNLLLGWTIIGWVVALVMALKPKPAPYPPYYPPQYPLPYGPPYGPGR